MTLDVAPLFSALPVVEGGFGAASVDPPWRFASNSDARPGRNARRHYATLKPAQLASLPLGGAMAKDAFVFLWIPGPFLVIGAHLPILEAWGFEPTAMGFDWVKLQRRFAIAPSLFFTEQDFFVGGGLTTRANAEYCVLARRGKPKRLDAGVRKLIIAPVGLHSEKPAEHYARIERYCVGPYIDVFARKRRDGWFAWGDQL
jgi:N6-adenosine-specific RNA methylase IME4